MSSLESLIGARLVVGLPGPHATPELIEQLRELHVHHLIIFERNVTSPEQFTALLHHLEERLERSLLVMVDHEGGRVVRFRSGVTKFPDARAMGRAQAIAAVEQQGAVEAHELRQLGVRVNLAPCVDVLVEGCDPVIGDRSYGADPQQVSECAVARIRGLQSHGVAACAKHFPGLGAVPRDPHTTLPTVMLGGEAMERTHLPPFRAAIKTGVAMVMSSHVCYPQLGDPPGLPATFSPRLIQGVLRERLGFSGVIATDDLEMGALRSFGSIGESAIRATDAGHDLLLICGPHLTAAQEAFSELQQAYRSGRLDERELLNHVAHIEHLRAAYRAARLENS